MARILMVSSEAAPYAKTGGLSDVLGALPQALVARGEEVAVLIPHYRGMPINTSVRVAYGGLRIELGSFTHEVDILETSAGGVTFYFADSPPLYNREGLYGDAGRDHHDNHIRFAVLDRTALALARYVFRPDVIHCHDWQAGLVPLYLRDTFRGDPTFSGIKTLLTIHNLGYQGIFGAEILADVGIAAELFRPNVAEFYGNVNFLMAGMHFADAINTVSRRYAEEIQTPEFGFHLDGFLRANRGKLSGILNGVDYSRWSPETDPHIARNYSAEDLTGKSVCKRALMAEFGIPESRFDRPLIGIISRFAAQKGFDIVAGVASELEAEDISMVVLGSGDPATEGLFQTLAARNPGKFGVRIGYDDPLAHRIEAGADIFLMPSRYEPCGLNQIYSLRYGTVPLVRATGGLDDTIEEGTGFKFWSYASSDLLAAVRHACVAFKDREGWTEMMRRGMSKDFSWKKSAGEYADLYRRLLA